MPHSKNHKFNYQNTLGLLTKVGRLFKVLYMYNCPPFSFFLCRKLVWLFCICAESTVHLVLVNCAASFASKDALKRLDTKNPQRNVTLSHWQRIVDIVQDNVQSGSFFS